MKSAVVYATRHGTSRKVADRIATALGDCETYSIQEARNLDPAAFERIVLGCSIHAGNSPKSMRDFCRRHREALLARPLALFLCSMNPKEREHNRDVAYPKELRNHALACELVGGEYLVDRMNFVERFLVRRFSGATSSLSMLDEAAMERLVTALRA